MIQFLFSRLPSTLNTRVRISDFTALVFLFIVYFAIITPASSASQVITSQKGAVVVENTESETLHQAEPVLAGMKMRFRKFVAYAEFLQDSMENLSADFISEMRQIETLARDEKVLKAKFRVLQLEQKYLGGLETLSSKFESFIDEVTLSHKRCTDALIKLKNIREGDIYLNHLRAIDADKNKIDELHESFLEKESFVRESYKGLRQIFDALRYEHGALIYKIEGSGSESASAAKPLSSSDKKDSGKAGAIPLSPVSSAQEPAVASGKGTVSEKKVSTGSVMVTAVAGEKIASAEPYKKVEQQKNTETAKTVEKAETSKKTVSEKKSEYPVIAFQDLPERESANKNFARPFCVTIENHPGARPQSGLQLADIVYEFLAEGGITRFLGVYSGRNGILGPVRSCRHYFTDIVGQYDAIYVHCGSSNQGLQALKARKIDFMNEIKFSKPFYRVKFRKSPHNLYTTLEKLELGADRMGFRRKGDVALPADHFSRFETTFKAEKPGKFVKITYHRKYSVAYSYDEKSNTYLRMINSAPHVVYGADIQLSTPNILLIKCPTRQIDSYGRLDIDLTGKGSAMAVRGGESIQCTWSKTDSRARMIISDSQGQPVLFNPGQIWIQVVRDDVRTIPPMSAER